MKTKFSMMTLVLLLSANTMYGWEGLGTENYPYLINTPEDLNQLATNVNNGETYDNKFFQLAADLDFTGKEFAPIGKCEGDETGWTVYNPFSGTFDGANHTIKGINVNQSEMSNVGMFGFITGATIKNLKLTDCTFTGDYGVGGIVGSQEEIGGIISNCHVSNTVTVTGNDCVGGIVGALSYYTVSDCTSAAHVSCGTEYVGAIVGWAMDDVENENDKCLFTNNKFYPVNVTGNKPYYGGLRTGSEEPIVCYIITVNGITLPTEPSFTSEGITYYAEGMEVSLPEGIECSVFDGKGNPIDVTDGKFSMPAKDITVKGTGTTPIEGTNIELQDLADNTQTLLDNNGKTVDVLINGRTLYKDGSWNTICLPFNIESDNIINQAPDFFAMWNPQELESSSLDKETGTLTLTFKTATDIVAGKPYLVKWTGGGEIVNPRFKNVVISSTTPQDVTVNDLVTFKGTYAPVTLAANDRTKLYLGADNNLYYPDADVPVNSFRAYFLLNGITAGDANFQANRFVFNFGDGETNGISGVIIEKDEKASGWHTLDGRRLNGIPIVKGIYIHQGRKVAIK